jgi:hypothetical protein
MGYSMILYPTTVLFRAVHSMQLTLEDMKRGIPLSPDDRVNLPAFEEIINMPEWSEIETHFMGKGQSGGVVGRLKRTLTGA